MRTFLKYIVALLLMIPQVVFSMDFNVMAENHIYKGRYPNSSDILTTWDGRHLYSGRYVNSSAILYTWDGKHLYRGRYTNSSDILYTFDGRHVYRGRYTNSSDILLSVDAPVPIIILLLNTL